MSRGEEETWEGEVKLGGICEDFPGREKQIVMLEVLFTGAACPPVLTVYGPEATGKKTVLKRVLAKSGVRHAMVNVGDCVSIRQVVETIMRECINAFGDNEAGEGGREKIDGLNEDGVNVIPPRTDSLASLLARLEIMVRRVGRRGTSYNLVHDKDKKTGSVKRTPRTQRKPITGNVFGETQITTKLTGSNIMNSVPRFILILTGHERARQLPSTMVPALSRFPQYVPGLSVIFVQRTINATAFNMAYVPHIEFPRYTAQQMIGILALQKPVNSVQDAGDLSNFHNVDIPSDVVDVLWTRFCEFVWKSMGREMLGSLTAFRRVCYRLWPYFIRPLRINQISIDEALASGSSQYFIRLKSVFRCDGIALGYRIPYYGVDSTTYKMDAGGEDDESVKVNELSGLPIICKYILCAAYLASQNKVKHDVIFFVASNAEQAKRRRRRNLESHKRKHGANDSAAGGSGAFSLDRLLAILRAILPDKYVEFKGVDEGSFVTADLLTHITTLTLFNLLVCMRTLPSINSRMPQAHCTYATGIPANYSATVASCILSPVCRWKANVDIELVRTLGRDVEFDVEKYLARNY